MLSGSCAARLSSRSCFIGDAMPQYHAMFYIMLAAAAVLSIRAMFELGQLAAYAMRFGVW